MVKFFKGALLAGAASMVLASAASAAWSPFVTALEFKCMQQTSKGASKFVGAKSKCASKCQGGARKALNPFTDCDPPFAGATATCIFDSIKGAEAKYAAAIAKACDDIAAPGKVDCPECYSGGDCSNSGHATAWVGFLEPQIDVFGPLIWPVAHRANPAYAKCMDTAAKAATKEVSAINKCYDKCAGNVAKGIGNAGDCAAPAPTDAATTACLFDTLKGAVAKAAAAIDKACVAGATPPGYPTGSTWASTVYTAVAPNTGLTYCASPSGAFVAD